MAVDPELVLSKADPGGLVGWRHGVVCVDTVVYTFGGKWCDGAMSTGFYFFLIWPGVVLTFVAI